MLLITSVNEELFKAYGQRMTEEFSAASDGTVRLCVVYEGDTVPPPLRNVDFLRFEHPGHATFMRKFGKLHEARGLRIEFVTPTQVNMFPDFRFNAVRFSFKVFSILVALAVQEPKEYFAWIDADVRCLKSFSSKSLEPFFPEPGEVMSYLGRTKFPLTGPYSECGFLGFRADNTQTGQFLQRMADVYTSGEVFSHQEWHDSWLWDQVRLEFEGNGAVFRNLSGPAEITNHPFINSGLGEFFDHLKGLSRKAAGRSHDKDYLLRKR